MLIYVKFKETQAIHVHEMKERKKNKNKVTLELISNVNIIKNLNLTFKRKEKMLTFHSIHLIIKFHSIICFIRICEEPWP